MNTFCNLEDWKMSGRVFLHAIKVLYSRRLQKNLDKNPRCVFLHPDSVNKIFSADVFGFNNRKYITMRVKFVNFLGTFECITK